MRYSETPLIAPPGKRKGCLRRTDSFGSRFKPMADQTRILSWEEIKHRMHSALSLRPFVRQILDQDGVGSCAAEAVTQAIMTTRVKAGQPHVLLNPWSIYQETSGGRDRGSNIGDNIAFATEQGCLPKAVWPRSKGWRTKPPQELWDRYGKHFRLDEVGEIGEAQETASALVDAFAIVFGWQGHSCMLDHLLDEDTAEYANSWKQTWGDEGFGKVYLRSINYGYGQFAVRTTTICPKRVLDELAVIGSSSNS